MVISRLEHHQKPRLRVETAAKLARVLGWTLDQFCGLAPAPAIPDALPPYNPWLDGMPAWLVSGLPTSAEDRRLATPIWSRGGTGEGLAQIAAQLTIWGVKPFGARVWNYETVRQCRALDAPPRPRAGRAAGSMGSRPRPGSSRGLGGA